MNEAIAFLTRNNNAENGHQGTKAQRGARFLLFSFLVKLCALAPSWQEKLNKK